MKPHKFERYLPAHLLFIYRTLSTGEDSCAYCGLHRYDAIHMNAEEVIVEQTGSTQ